MEEGSYHIYMWLNDKDESNNIKEEKVMRNETMGN